MKSLLIGLVAVANVWSAEQMRVQPVSRTPAADTVKVVVALPKSGAVLKGNPVWVQLRVDGFALGADSGQFDRADEIAVSGMGQTIHLVVDDMPYFAVNEPALDPFNEQGFYYDTSYKFEIPKKLSKGLHVLRAFPARSYGESLKGEKTFFATTFYVGTNEDAKTIDLSKPYITYNEPSSQMELSTEQPILLDFYLSNCELTSDGYRVRLSLDGNVHRILSVWVPYYIYGLSRGKHTVRLELIDKHDKLVDGPYSDVSETIMVH
ncbi:MAG TPA: hypothetical protein VGM34_03230 [Chlamydiales bacterium]|jgi:hypothetical protein